MKRHLLNVALTLRAPFLFPGQSSMRFGLDASALRDRDGVPLVPQDQLRGVLRHACADVLTALGRDPDARDALFGSGSGDCDQADKGADAAQFAPARSRLIFSDLRADSEQNPSFAVRVAIDEDTGAAKTGALLFAELVAPPGAEVTFSGQAVLYATDAEADAWLGWLNDATSWISAVGAMKSAGFGEVTGFTITRDSSADLVVAPAPSPARQRYALRLDRPFLVDAERVGRNAFRGREEIPGGVLKGALATRLAHAGQLDTLNQALSAMRIGFARRKGVREKLPKSLMSAVLPQQGVVYRDAVMLGPDQAPVLSGTPMAFASDWKAASWEKLPEAFAPLPALERDLRIHVAIEEGANTAEDEKLFIFDSVVPGDTTWLFDVDYTDVPEPERGKLHAWLLSGLDGIGKTGAIATIETADPAERPGLRPLPGQPDTYAIVLQSPAVMASPSDAPDTRAAYAGYWNRVLPGAVMKTFFATQRLAGGYIGRRFGARGTYAPFWLTEAGSVFVLSGVDETALKQLVDRGLPAPVVDGAETDWQSCPYQPENGYGAITAHYDPTEFGRDFDA